MVSNMTRKIVAALFLVLCLAGCADTVIFLPDDPVKIMAVPVGETEIPAGEPEPTEIPEPEEPVEESTETAKIQPKVKSPSSPNKGNGGTEGTTGSTTVTKPTATEPKETKPASTEPVETKPVPTESVQLRPTQPDPGETEPKETEPPATESVVIQATDPEETVPVSTKPKETEPSVTEPPVTEPPATEPPTTEPPVTEPPATEPPMTEPPMTEPRPTEPNPYDISGYTMGNLEYRILDRINGYRAEAGLEELYLDSYLCAIASCRGYEANLVWSHTRPDGRHFSTVLDDYGYSAEEVQELLAYATANAEASVDKWMSSESHRDILLGDFTTLGVGVYRVGGYTVVACLFIE